MTEAESREEEKIVLVVHRHWASLLPEFLAVLAPALVLAAFLLIPRDSIGFGAHAFFALLVPMCLLVIWLLMAVFWSNYYLTLLVITDRRIFHTEQATLVNRTISEWDITDVKRVSVSARTALESLFQYGTLTFETSDGEFFDIPSLADPAYVAAVILKQGDRVGELEETSRRQEELLHFISHEVKGHLAKSKAAFASIIEGDYGPVPAPLSSLAQTALADSQKGVETVMSILSGSDLKRGKMTLKKKPFDLTAAVTRAVGEARAAAVQKRLSLSSHVDKFCVVVGDEEKIEHDVIRNLLDNAIKYTQAGRIGLTLEKEDGTARLTISDTGVGMTDDDMRHLFTQGGHGKDSKKVNPDSTGYGLYIAKQLVKEHGGKIGASSEGPGMGSTFWVELPIAE